MRVLVHVERVTTDTAEVWINVDDENMMHSELIETAAKQASNESKWEIDRFYISTGVGSYIVKREA